METIVTAARRRAHIDKVEAGEIIGALPEIRAVQPGDVFDEDLWICATGFEDRALAWGKHLGGQKKARVGYLLSGDYDTNRNDNSRNHAPLCTLFQKLSAKVEIFKCDTPGETFRTISECVAKLASERNGKPLRVAFDVSAASNRVILSVMAILLRAPHHIHLKIVYAEPEHYVPSEHEFRDDPEGLIESALGTAEESIHEVGVGEIAPNPLYPGVSGTRGHHLIVIPSHHMERVASILNSLLDPGADTTTYTSISWLLGEPLAKNAWRKRFQIEVLRRGLAKLGRPDFGKELDLPDAQIPATSTLDYRETATKVIERVDGSLGNQITLVPMGSKMQAVGCALALSIRSECSVTHASPQRFNPRRYSSGIGPLWSLNLKLRDVKETFATIGMLRIINDPLSEISR